MRYALLTAAALGALTLGPSPAAAADGCLFDRGRWYCYPGAQPGVPYYGPNYGRAYLRPYSGPVYGPPPAPPTYGRHYAPRPHYRPACPPGFRFSNRRQACVPRR